MPMTHRVHFDRRMREQDADPDNSRAAFFDYKQRCCRDIDEILRESGVLRTAVVGEDIDILRQRLVDDLVNYFLG